MPLFKVTYKYLIYTTEQLGVKALTQEFSSGSNLKRHVLSVWIKSAQTRSCQGVLTTSKVAVEPLFLVSV